MRFSTFSVLIILTASSTSHAADLAPSEKLNDRWDGFYAGLNVGYGAGEFTQALKNTKWGADENYDGFLAGATLGYNKSYDRIVVGLEADFQVSNIEKSFSTDADWTCVPTDACKNKIDWFGTLRARLGLQIGKFLPYVTGGLAIASVHSYDAPVAVAGSTNLKAVEMGWTAGGGLEASVTDNVSLKFDMLYIDLGKTKANVNNYYTKNKFIVGRMGLNWNF
ncbi:outer membrane immunogenic protein [Pseudovibrio sp. Tun.PSC04-5.I4]|nr:outer membrane immunogenic protein [Pseudovibrio sp. Tun.PSC04-5.I4]